MHESSRRRIVAWASVSIDGRTSGPDGPAGDTWLYAHAMQEDTSIFYEGVWRGATTALVGRTNYDGFASVWPDITRDPATDDRTRALGRWLEAVEKVVVSHHDDLSWENSRVTHDLEAEVRALKGASGGDILVLNSASVVRQLLELDLVDDLWLAIVPVVLGDGLRLLPDGLPPSDWRLAQSTTLAHGAIGVHYRRARET